MNNKINKAKGTINGTRLFWPDQIDHIWSYCLYLGAFVGSDMTVYDLGVYVSNSGVSYAITYGNEPNEYISGIITCNDDIYPPTFDREGYQQAMCETFKRAFKAGLLGK